MNTIYQWWFAAELAAYFSGVGCAIICFFAGTSSLAISAVLVSGLLGVTATGLRTFAFPNR